MQLKRDRLLDHICRPCRQWLNYYYAISSIFDLIIYHRKEIFVCWVRISNLSYLVTKSCAKNDRLFILSTMNLQNSLKPAVLIRNILYLIYVGRVWIVVEYFLLKKQALNEILLVICKQNYFFFFFDKFKKRERSEQKTKFVITFNFFWSNIHIFLDILCLFLASLTALNYQYI